MRNYILQFVICFIGLMNVRVASADRYCISDLDLNMPVEESKLATLLIPLVKSNPAREVREMFVPWLKQKRFVVAFEKGEANIGDIGGGKGLVGLMWTWKLRINKDYPGETPVRSISEQLLGNKEYLLREKQLLLWHEWCHLKQLWVRGFPREPKVGDVDAGAPDQGITASTSPELIRKIFHDELDAYTEEVKLAEKVGIIAVCPHLFIFKDYEKGGWPGVRERVAFDIKLRKGADYFEPLLFRLGKGLED